jgi:hypothetical protein
VLNLDPADFSDFALAHADAFNAGGTAAAKNIPPVPQIGGWTLQVVWNARNPSAEQWASQRSSKLIQDLLDDQRETVRTALQRGLAAGQNPRTVALDVVGRVQVGTRQRVGGVIGLHSTQEEWLANYTRDLASTEPETLRSLLERGLRDKRFDPAVRAALAKGTGIPPDLQAKMRAAYAVKALKWRGDNIARTETLRALGAAQSEAYQQAIDKGQLAKGDLRKFWVTAGDERVRESHRLIPGMNPNGRAWDEPFATPHGPSMHAPHDTDPQCRCMERVKIDFIGRAAAAFKAEQVG